MTRTWHTGTEQSPSHGCDYCGLPVAAAGPDGAPAYCCFGCRFAAEVTHAQGETAAQRWTALTLGLAVFCTMNVVMLTMALWSYAAQPATPFEAALGDFLRYGALLFAAPVLLFLGRPLAASAVEQWRRGVWSTDLLLLTGVVAAFFVSVVSTLQGRGHVYFEVSCVILVLVTLGRWLEATGRLQASAALDHLERLLPSAARVRGASGREEQRPLADIGPGDEIRVLAGERIPIDGSIRTGRAVVDEQFFTGESVPVEKQAGDPVLGGSFNLDGDLWISVTAPASEGALARLIEAVRTARLAKGEFQELADRWSRWFFPIVGGIALGTFALHARARGWEAGLLTALSVVLIACPCALALATPLAVWVALGEAASRGVLIRSGAALERWAGVRALRWDKTGTLTTGAPRVRRLACESEAAHDDVAKVAAALTSASGHLFSQAIREFLRESVPRDLADVRTVAGCGLSGVDAELGPVALGSWRWLEECGHTVGRRLPGVLAEREHATSSLVLVGWHGRIQGVFFLDETLRPEALETVALCHDLGLDQAVYTGDRRGRAALLQRELQIPVEAELLPEDKLAAIQATRRKVGPVAMIGDGLNDAPALAAADVGIALASGADVSRDSADLCLLSNDLRLIPWSFRLARDTVRTIRWNLFWSFAYNGLGVVVAAAGGLHPAVAAVLMVVSSLMVLGNSLRLREPRTAPIDALVLRPHFPPAVVAREAG